MDILQPTLEQNPVFGNFSPGGSSLFLKWEYEFFKFLNWIGDVLPIIFSQEMWNIIKAVIAVVSIFCISVILYCSVRMFEIRKKERHHMEQEIAEYAHYQAEMEKAQQAREQESTNPRWVTVINYITSPDPAKWRLSILEADGMLNELLDQLGFLGETIGDKLKTANPKKFRNLPAAWEAHTVRNKIAHEGSDFVLNSREAKRVISLYEEIFREFGFI